MKIAPFLLENFRLTNYIYWRKFFKVSRQKKFIVFTDNKVRNFLISTHRGSYFTISTHVGIFFFHFEGCAFSFLTRKIFSNSKRTPIFFSFFNQNFSQTYSILIALDRLSCWNSAFSLGKKCYNKIEFSFSDSFFFYPENLILFYSSRCFFVFFN